MERSPAVWDGDILVSVDQLWLWEADVQGLFDEEGCIVAGLVEHTGLLPQHWIVLWPGMLRSGWLLHFSPSDGGPVLLDVGLNGSLCLPYMEPQLQGTWYTTPDIFFQQVFVLYLHQVSIEGGCRSEDCSDVVSLAYWHTCLTSLLSPPT